ncbi:MAG: TlpA family protein disulfide reductase [Burkholderiales bacterium]|nr:TlpA family protein disulfide reductase [Burkholderiales bacterium]
MNRRLFIGAAAALAVPALRAQAQVERLAAGTRLAPWNGFGLDGKPVAVPAAGKPTVVNFWATWCPPCRAEMPLLQQMAEFYGERLAFQAVNFKERAVTVQRHLREANWSIPVVLDPLGAGAQAWRVQVFPTTFGFDARGQPRWRVLGEYDWSSPQAGQLVESLWR